MRPGAPRVESTAMAATPLRRDLYEHALREAGILRRVVEEISSELELRPLLTRIVSYACELLRADDGAIALYDGARDVMCIEAVYRLPEREIGTQLGRGVGLAGTVLQTGEPMVLRRYGDLPNVTLPELADNAVIGVPIRKGTQLLGFFGIGARPPRVFDAQDLGELQLFARHAAIAIDNAVRYQRERTRSERMATILRISRLISAELEPVELVATAALVLHEQLGLPNVAIPLLEGDELVCHAYVGHEVFRRPYRLPVSRGITGAAARSRAVQLVNDVSRDPRYVKAPVPVDVLSELAVPIVLGQEVFGVVNVEGHVPFDEEDVAVLQIVADHLAVAIKNARLVEEVRRAAIMRERQMLARELHDSVSQVLSSISLMAQSLASAWRRDAREGERRAHRIEELSRLAFAEMRALPRELRPLGDDAAEPSSGSAGSLEDVRRHGLHRALERLAAVLAPETPRVELDFSGYAPQLLEREEILFRICQEALSNALRHARASRIGIAAFTDREWLRIEVKDDGCGFDFAQLTARAVRRAADGLGLQTMRERAEGLDGNVHVESALGRGTRIVLEVPRADREAP